MRGPSALLLVFVGLLLLWLAVTGRLADVWNAAVGAAAGEGTDGRGGSGGGTEGVSGAVPLPLPTLPAWGEYLRDIPTRYLPTGGGSYLTLPGGWGWETGPIGGNP